MQFITTDSVEVTPLLNANNLVYANDIDIKIVENDKIVGFIITTSTPIRFVGIRDFGCHSLAFDEYRLYILADSLEYQYDDVITTIPLLETSDEILGARPFVENMNNIIMKPNTTADITFNGGIFDPSIMIDFGDAAIVNSYPIITPTSIVANITSTSEEKSPTNIIMYRGSSINYGFIPTIEISNTIVGNGSAGVFTTDFSAGGTGQNAWGVNWNASILGNIDSLDGFYKTSSSKTPSSGTGPNSAYDGYYMFTERSGSNSGNGQRGIVSTSNFHELVELKFHFHMYGSGLGDLIVESQNSDDTWVQRWIRSGQQHTQSAAFEEIILDTTTWDAKGIRFVFDNSTSYAADIAIDSIIITSV